jgi:hypothetical protein
MHKKVCQIVSLFVLLGSAHTNAAHRMRISSGSSNPIKVFFLFADKLCHFTNIKKNLFNKLASLPAKTEKFFVSEEKSFIGSVPGGCEGCQKVSD